MPTSDASAASSSGYDREWDIARVAWQQVPTLLDQGWEPFAVVGRGPENEADLIYLRRKAEHD